MWGIRIRKGTLIKRDRGVVFHCLVTHIINNYLPLFLLRKNNIEGAEGAVRRPPFVRRELPFHSVSPLSSARET